MKRSKDEISGACKGASAYTRAGALQHFRHAMDGTFRHVFGSSEIKSKYRKRAARFVMHAAQKSCKPTTSACASIGLASGDNPTFVSDGVVEATHDKRELLGFERTQAIGSSQPTPSPKPRGQFGQEDDFSVMAVRILAGATA